MANEANPGLSRRYHASASHYLRKLYFHTTAINPKTLGFLIDEMEADGVLLRRDLPYEIGDADGAIALSSLKTTNPEAPAAALAAWRSYFHYLMST